MMMRSFYLAFPKIQMLSGQLSWSHYVEPRTTSQLFDLDWDARNFHLE